MRCFDCPELGLVETTVPPRKTCCLNLPREVFRSETATETAQRIRKDKGPMNRHNRRRMRAAVRRGAP